MNEKEMIEEMTRDIAFIFCPNRKQHEKWGNMAQCYSDNNFSDCKIIKNAVDKLYNAGYRKIPEGSVLLTKEEYEGKEIVVEMSGGHKLRLTVGKFGEMSRVLEDFTRKEMVKEILTNMDLLQENLNKKIEQLKEPFRQNMNSKQKESYKEGILAAKSIISSFKYNIAKQFGVEVEE